MRIAVALIAALGVAGVCLGACAPGKPPAGRWEGTFDSGDTLVAVRLEIDKDGAIYLSAPDAMGASADPDEREAIRQRLAEGLDQSWPEVPARQMEFDGKAFRKPGGVAPQMIWDPDSKHMFVILYPGTRASIRVVMHDVADFDSDPWPH